jgi:hypothetical protein
MKRVFAMVAILGLLTVPVLVSADDETIIPPEANWSAVPPTPAIVAAPQQREAALPQAQEGRRVVPGEASDDDGETVVPAEANWAPVPATPPIVATPQKREAVTPQAQESVRPTTRRTPAGSSYASFQDNALSQINDDNDE